MSIKLIREVVAKQRRDLEETVIRIKKGAFHKWLGKAADDPITQADIEKGLKAGGHAAKMANFAANAKEFHHEETQLDEANVKAASTHKYVKDLIKYHGYTHRSSETTKGAHKSWFDGSRHHSPKAHETVATQLGLKKHPHFADEYHGHVQGHHVTLTTQGDGLFLATHKTARSSAGIDEETLTESQHENWTKAVLKTYPNAQINTGKNRHGHNVSSAFNDGVHVANYHHQSGINHIEHSDGRWSNINEGTLSEGDPAHWKGKSTSVGNAPPPHGTIAWNRKYGKYTAKGQLRKKPNPNKPPESGQGSIPK